MGDTKIPDLYAVLGITNQRASQQVIQVAYENLSLQFRPHRRVGHVQPDAVELIKIQSAYDILSDPEKRAEYDQRRASVCHKVETTSERTRNQGQKSPLDERFPAARVQLQLRIKKRDRVRRTPLRAQLRVQAQLRAHERWLVQIQQQGLVDTDRKAQVESDDESEKVSGLVDQGYLPLESVNEDGTLRNEERKEALMRQATAEEEANLREEEVARKQAAAAEVRAKEIEWINQEAKDSILILAGMGGGAMRPLATGYAQMLHEDYVRRLVGRTDDLLEYLWDKVHSGDWICPEIKEAIDLDRLLGLVLRREAQRSHFPSATQERAASLLRKWRGEDCDETDGSASPAQETPSQPSSDSESSDGDSSGEESEAEGELPSASSQCECQANMSGEAHVAKNAPTPACPQAAEPQRSPFAQNAYQPSPFAQNSRQPSPFAQNTQQRFAPGNQQFNMGPEVSFAGWKRV